MSVTRRAVLEQLAAASDPTRAETTTIEALAGTLGTDASTVEEHLEGLEACELAHREPDGRARVTITGEQFLALETDEMAIIDTVETDEE